MQMNVQGKTVLITGVSSGIGKGLCEHFLSRGWEVFGTLRRPDPDLFCDTDTAERFHPLVFDVTAPAEDHEALMERLAGILGDTGLDLLIHNAGVALGGPLAWQSPDEVRTMFETNVLGVQKLTRAAIGALRQGRPGRMVLLSSVSGRLVTPFIGAYAGTKFAIEAFADAYRAELGLLGVKVVCVQFGPTRTRIWTKARANTGRYADSPYTDILALQDRLIEQTEAGAMPVERVVRAIWSVSVDPHPPARKLIATNAAVVRLAGWLPVKWRDRLVMSRLGNAKKW